MRADLDDVAADRTHGDDDAQHRRDDAEAGQAVGDLGQCVRRRHHFVMVLLQLQFQQRFQFMRFDVAADHQAQAVGDEVHQVMVGEHLGVLVEQIARGRGVHVRFQRDETLAARLVQQLVHQGQHVQVVGRLVFVALEHRGDAGEGRLHHLGRVAHQERAQRGAADDHQLERLPERGEFSVRGDEAAQHAGDDDEDSNDDEHGVARRAGYEGMSAPGRDS